MLESETIGEAPCDKCFKTQECELGKACLPFWQYVETNRYNNKIRKIPSTEIYNKVFYGDEMSLKEIKAFAKQLLKEQQDVQKTRRRW